MRKCSVVVAIFAAGIAVPAFAQTGGAMMKSEPGKVSAAQTTKATATITAIDAASRAITLKTSKGEQLTVFAGPEVKNFAQMKVGDQVEAEYIEALSLELKKGGGKPVARTEKGGMESAKPGEMPAAAAGRRVTVVADVVDLNPQKQTVTLKGPQRTVELKVRDPEQFKLIAKGDQVEATYTEAVAVAVTPKK